MQTRCEIDANHNQKAREYQYNRGPTCATDQSPRPVHPKQKGVSKTIIDSILRAISVFVCVCVTFLRALRLGGIGFCDRVLVQSACTVVREHASACDTKFVASRRFI